MTLSHSGIGCCPPNNFTIIQVAAGAIRAAVILMHRRTTGTCQPADALRVIPRPAIELEGFPRIDEKPKRASAGLANDV